MDDIRWFAPDRLFALVVPRLRQLGLSIALDGDRPARLVFAMDARVAAQAYRYAVGRGCPLIHYIWDLPPWRLGRGGHDWIWYALGHYLRLPRLGRRYAERPGYYSRLRYVAVHAREVWVPSALTATSVRERFGVECRQVPFCYDSDRFVPSPAPSDRAPVLVSVSRLTLHKNHAAVIRAAARFDPKLAVRIIGEGPERRSLERLATELGVPCAVEGGLNDSEVLAAYRSAGIVVCPSRFEGFGLTPLEAIGCGVPVVASDIPPHREFLGAAAQYFTLDDDASLVAAIVAARRAGPPPRDVLDNLSIDAAARRFFDGLAPHLD